MGTESVLNKVCWAFPPLLNVLLLPPHPPAAGGTAVHSLAWTSGVFQQAMQKSGEMVTLGVRVCLSVL